MQPRRHFNPNQVVGKKVTITIKRLGINGEGIGYFRKKIIFIAHALPGEVVFVQITAAERTYLTGKLLKIKQVSPDRITPPQSQVVGGLELAHLRYAKQLEYKADLFKQALAKRRPQGFDHYEIKATLGMKDPLHYRNKAAFPVRKQHGKLVAGMYQPNSHKLVALTKMATQKELTMELITSTLAELERLGVSAYDERKRTGCVKTLVVRQTDAPEQLQLVVVTRTATLPHAAELAASLQHKYPQLVSVMQNVHPSRSARVFGPHFEVIAGQDFVSETLGPLHFDLTAPAFFQLNTKQAKVLYDQVKVAAQVQPTDVVVDAYCGVGTIGLYLANDVAHVRGMDEIPAAITAAKQNATTNHITNAEYFAGKAEKLLPQWLHQGLRADTVIVDPPRVGLADELIAALLAHAPQTIVYVTCNPSTFARDLVKLTTKYRVEFIQPVDMFPQTARTEGVCRLVLKK